MSLIKQQAGWGLSRSVHQSGEDIRLLTPGAAAGGGGGYCLKRRWCAARDAASLSAKRRSDALVALWQRKRRDDLHPARLGRWRFCQGDTSSRQMLTLDDEHPHTKRVDKLKNDGGRHVLRTVHKPGATGRCQEEGWRNRREGEAAGRGDRGISRYSLCNREPMAPASGANKCVIARPDLIFPPSLVRVPIVCAPVRVKEAAQTLGLNDLPQTSEATHRAFFLDEEGGIDLGGRIIQRHHQTPLAAGHPFMSGAILMQHHPGQGFAKSLLTVRATPRGTRHLPGRLQRLLVQVYERVPPCSACHCSWKCFTIRPV
jgi:hypothetical protein